MVGAFDPMQGNFLEKETYKAKPKERVRFTRWRWGKKWTIFQVERIKYSKTRQGEGTERSLVGYGIKGTD